MSDIKEIRELPKALDTKPALIEASQKLRSLGVDFALIGGLALAFYGIERYTKDVDFAVTLATSGKAEAAFQDLDLRPLRLGGVSILTASGVRADFIDRRIEYRTLFEEALAAACKNGPWCRVEEELIAVVPLSYLVALKLIADRPQDEADLKAMLIRNTFDYQEAREIIARHVGSFAARYLDKLSRSVGRLDAPKEYLSIES